jgi:acetolactate synthase-1/2/3 large subunit
LVDDSQMFGGLVAERYDMLPHGLRVFGGHGGFVGGGLAYATGLAIADPDADVLCMLGDQAFTNSFQGLVAAVQQRARVLFVVCNNGESVSLKKQARASDPRWFGNGTRSYLDNAVGLSYHDVASALGVWSARVEIPFGPDPATIDRAAGRFSRLLEQARDYAGPALIELCLPADPEAWRGIWLTQGFEQRAPMRISGS